MWDGYDRHASNTIPVNMFGIVLVSTQFPKVLFNCFFYLHDVLIPTTGDAFPYSIFQILYVVAKFRIFNHRFPNWTSDMRCIALRVNKGPDMMISRAAWLGNDYP